MRWLVPMFLAAIMIPLPAKAAEGPCTGYEWKRPPEVARMIRCVWPRFHVRHGGPRKALSVGRCESGLRWDAYGNGNGGVFQHRLVYWPSRYRYYIERNRLRRSWGLPGSVYSARTNVIVTALMVRRGGWGSWACA